MEDLIDVLEKEEEQYEQLIELGKRKKQAVIKADISSLEQITEKEQDAAGNLHNLAKHRTEVLTDMAAVLGKDAQDMTILKMISYLDGQPNEQQKLSQVRTRLLNTGNQMMELNRQNEVLLNQALEMVQFDLTLFKSMKQAPETANYNKNAHNTGDLLGTSGFDARQ